MPVPLLRRPPNAPYFQRRFLIFQILTPLSRRNNQNLFPPVKKNGREEGAGRGLNNLHII